MLELQSLTGYLNFVSIVTPLGRTLLHCIYNMQIYFPEERKQQRRRISRKAYKDVRWWLKVLA